MFFQKMLLIVVLLVAVISADTVLATDSLTNMETC